VLVSSFWRFLTGVWVWLVDSVGQLESVISQLGSLVKFKLSIVPGVRVAPSREEIRRDKEIERERGWERVHEGPRGIWRERKNPRVCVRAPGPWRTSSTSAPFFRVAGSCCWLVSPTSRLTTTSRRETTRVVFVVNRRRNNAKAFLSLSHER
jgi:hypothetical protein